MNRPATNSKAGQLGALLDVAREHGATVYEIIVEPKRIRLITQPLAESATSDNDLRDF